MRSLSDRWIYALTNSCRPANVTSSLRRTFDLSERAQYQPIRESPPEVARTFQDDPFRPYGTRQLEVAHPHLSHRHCVGSHGELPSSSPARSPRTTSPTTPRTG